MSGKLVTPSNGHKVNYPAVGGGGQNFDTEALAASFGVTCGGLLQRVGSLSFSSDSIFILSHYLALTVGDDYLREDLILIHYLFLPLLLRILDIKKKALEFKMEGNL